MPFSEPPPDGPLPASPALSIPRAYRDFTFGTGMWFGGWGMLQVLFSWLVVGELQAREELVGIAQLALTFPALFVLLIGGVVADRVDRRRLLVGLQIAAGSLAVALAAAVWAGALSFGLVIAFALTMGAVSAFSFPARDALLYDVAGTNLMRAVTGITLIQFVGQGVGQLLAGSARYLGSPTTLALEGLLFLVGAVGFARISPSVSSRARRAEPVRLAELLEGIREVVRSPILRPAWLLAVGVGLFFAGPYFVVFPLLNREYFGGDVGELSLIYMTFPAGSILGLSLLWRRGRMRRPGRAIALAQATAAVSLLVISAGIPFAATLLAGTVWGVCGAFFISATRTLFQEKASDAHRARVLSVQMLGVLGAGTLGSPLAGFLAGRLGALGAFTFCGIAMLIFVAAVCLFTDIWAYESSPAAQSSVQLEPPS
jgi:MFS family permease